MNHIFFNTSIDAICLYTKVLTYLYRKTISLANILTLICEIQCMKDKDDVNTRIPLSVCPCPLHIKFDKFFLDINQLIFLYRE